MSVVLRNLGRVSYVVFDAILLSVIPSTYPLAVALSSSSRVEVPFRDMIV